MDADKIQGAVEALTDDYHRAGGYLTQDRIERVLARRSLTAAEHVAVLDALADAGLMNTDVEPIEEPDEEPATLNNEPIDDTSIATPVASDGDRENESVYTNASDLFRTADKFGLLTPNQEVELGRTVALAQRAEADLATGTIARSETVAEIIRRGNEARGQFLCCNIRLVISIATRYSLLTDLAADDLIQDGMLGLMRAIEKFDHTRGFRFTTYATWWIRQSVTRALADTGRTIRLPVHIAEKVNKIRKTERVLTRYRGGCEPTLRQLADELEWTPDYVQFLRDVAQTCASLNTPVDSDTSSELGDFVVASSPHPDEVVEKLDEHQVIEQLLSTLPERDANVIRLRYGLSDEPPLTLEQVGQRYGVTRERIRQIQAKAERNLAAKFGRDYPELQPL